jgi:hypothetical protein
MRDVRYQQMQRNLHLFASGGSYPEKKIAKNIDSIITCSHSDTKRSEKAALALTKINIL